MHVDLYKLIESYTDNYIYYYIVKNNKKNIYIKNMKLQILKFYNQYNINGNYIKSGFGGNGICRQSTLRHNIRR